jgi:adenylate kinase
VKLLFLGPPGAGKGTQAEAVAEAKGIAHVSTGAMFRQHVSDGTELGEEVKAIMDRGDLVPDSITIAMLEERIARPDAAGGYILDGFPRTSPQVEALDAAIGEDALDAVIVLEVPEDELTKRMLSRGRADDTEESVRNRLAVYRADTEPLIDLYTKRGIVSAVSGLGDIDEITERILSTLDS